MAELIDRQQELAANLARVETRIVAACVAASRPREAVTLVAITKTYPASDAALLRELGVTDLGENRDQEAGPKAREVRGVRWHFVGRLQSNKARAVATYADVVQSVDRSGLVAPLSAGAVRAGRRCDVLLQVSLDDDPERGGVVPGELMRLADEVAAADGLVVKGVMAVASLGLDPRPQFARLAGLSAELTAVHPEAGVISAGMSLDLEAAIEAGATHVRVGSAILGARPAPLG